MGRTSRLNWTGLVAAPKAEAKGRKAMAATNRFGRIMIRTRRQTLLAVFVFSKSAQRPAKNTSPRLLKIMPGRGQKASFAVGQRPVSGRVVTPYVSRFTFHVSRPTHPLIRPPASSIRTICSHARTHSPAHSPTHPSTNPSIHQSTNPTSAPPSPHPAQPHAFHFRRITAPRADVAPAHVQGAVHPHLQHPVR